MVSDDACERFQTLLASDGVRAAIIYLNSLTPHRFTSMMLLGDDISRSLVFVDRERLDDVTTMTVPTLATYCVFVRDTGRPFALADSVLDPRVVDHAKREELRSYCGVPLTGRDGRIFGALCHFDVKPVPISPAMIDLMERIAPLLEVIADPANHLPSSAVRIPPRS